MASLYGYGALILKYIAVCITVCIIVYCSAYYSMYQVWYSHSSTNIPLYNRGCIVRNTSRYYLAVLNHSRVAVDSCTVRRRYLDEQTISNLHAIRRVQLKLADQVAAVL